MPDWLLQLHASIMDADRIPALAAAIFITMVIGMITGSVAGNANPFIWGLVNLFLGKLGDRMDKLNRKSADLMFRGFLLTIFALFFILVCSRIILRLSIVFPYMEMLVLCLCLSSGAIWFALLRLYFALEQQGKAKGAFYAVSRSTRIDLNSTDDFGITRVAMGYAATGFNKGLVAPSIWYLIGGLPAVLVYSVLAALAWRFGKCGFSKGFGKVPMALEKLMGYVPALVTGALFTLASAITPTAKLGKSLARWWQAKDIAPYEEDGIAVSALAWPLEVSLGGAVQDISGSALQKSWVGAEGSTAKISHKHLKRAIFLNVIAHFLFILALLAAYIYAGKAL